MFRHIRIKYPAPCTCRFMVRSPFNFVKLVHLLINHIYPIYGLVQPPDNFGPKRNPTCPSHLSMIFPHLLTNFGSRSQGLNMNRSYFATFCDRRIDNEVKSECFLHPQFTFYPHPTSGKYKFLKPTSMHMGGMQQIIKLGEELLHKLLLQSELKMK